MFSEQVNYTENTRVHPSYVFLL